jgi:hypothetical protein
MYDLYVGMLKKDKVHGVTPCSGEGEEDEKMLSLHDWP